MNGNFVELYQWVDSIEDYVLVGRVKQDKSCKLIRSVRRRKWELGDQLPACPALTGELADCPGCKWYTGSTEEPAEDLPVLIL